MTHPYDDLIAELGKLWSGAMCEDRARLYSRLRGAAKAFKANREALNELDKLLDFSADIDDGHPLSEICFVSEINKTWAKAHAALQDPKP